MTIPNLTIGPGSPLSQRVQFVLAVANGIMPEEKEIFFIWNHNCLIPNFEEYLNADGTILSNRYDHQTFFSSNGEKNELIVRRNNYEQFILSGNVAGVNAGNTEHDITAGFTDRCHLLLTVGDNTVKIMLRDVITGLFSSDYV